MAKCVVCGVDVSFDMVQHFVPDATGEKHRVCKSCATQSRNKALKFDPSIGRMTIVEYSDAETRKRCNVCGKVFCYNPSDLLKNEQKKNSATWSAIGSIGGALGGYYGASAVHQGNADRAQDAIVDYNKCPQCGSTNLSVISDEEFAAGINPGGAQQAAVSQMSLADELKKFKELLDMGAISQEEFDEKKKAILHGATTATRQPDFAAKQSQPTASATPVQSVSNYAETNKKSKYSPKTTFWVITLAGVFWGLYEVFTASKGFRSVYRGMLEFAVGHEAYISAWAALLVWVGAAVGLGFLLSRLGAKMRSDSN